MSEHGIELVLTVLFKRSTISKKCLLETGYITKNKQK